MKRKIVAGMLILSIGISNLYAMKDGNKDYSEALYSCMAKNITNKQKEYIKEYGVLYFAYPDKIMSKLLNVNKRQAKDISIKASKAFIDLMVNKCKKETKDLFINRSLPEAYVDFRKVINKLTAFVFNNPNDIDIKKREELTNWLKEGIDKDNDFKNFVHKIYLLKVKNKKE